jgi:hypothetical protein
MELALAAQVLHKFLSAPLIKGARLSKKIREREKPNYVFFLFQGLTHHHTFQIVITKILFCVFKISKI